MMMIMMMTMNCYVMLAVYALFHVLSILSADIVTFNQNICEREGRGERTRGGRERERE